MGRKVWLPAVSEPPRGFRRLHLSGGWGNGKIFDELPA